MSGGRGRGATPGVIRTSGGRSGTNRGRGAGRGAGRGRGGRGGGRGAAGSAERDEISGCTTAAQVLAIVHGSGARLQADAVAHGIHSLARLLAATGQMSKAEAKLKLNKSEYKEWARKTEKAAEEGGGECPPEDWIPLLTATTSCCPDFTARDLSKVFWAAGKLAAVMQAAAGGDGTTLSHRHFNNPRKHPAWSATLSSLLHWGFAAPPSAVLSQKLVAMQATSFMMLTRVRFQF